MTTSVELWRAKVEVIASFAGGPAMMIDDESERDRRVASLLALVEIEYSDVERPSDPTPIRSLVGTARPSPARIIPITGEELHVANTKINWPTLIETLRSHPHKSKTLIYDKMHTATVTAGRVRMKWPEILCETERRGEKGALILTFIPDGH